MSAYTTDLLDDALLAGYSFASVIEALNAGDHDAAGKALAAVLDAYAGDDGEPRKPFEELFPGMAAMLDSLTIRPIGGAK